MNKSDLISELARKHDLSEKAAAGIVDIIFEGFTKALQKGDRIEIRGFGTFSVREYSAHAGRNPKTDKKIKVAAKKLPYFRPGRELRMKVNVE